ncbi:MAG: hypothetical protein CM15mP120_06170 [Pseudomonadota bacterium]|nr:MAG: hypothetical protein CM15mP120_06170 [Pseudomonadota bacterium]
MGGPVLAQRALGSRFDTHWGPCGFYLGGRVLSPQSKPFLAPPGHPPYQTIETHEHNLGLNAAGESPRFFLGSTVICFFPQKGRGSFWGTLAFGKTRGFPGKRFWGQNRLKRGWESISAPGGSSRTPFG